MKLLKPSALAGVLLLCAWPSQSLAQTKIAVVDFQGALLATADIQKQSAEIESKYKGRQEELTQMTEELQEIQTKLQTAQGAEAQRLQAEGQRKQRSAQRMSEDLQSDVEFDRQTILNAAGLRMRDVIRDLRIEKEIDVILFSTSVLAASALIDLTAEATQAYDAKHPATP